jgi:ribosome maturation factor RimP
MEAPKLTEQIETLIMPCITALSAELVELSVNRHQGRVVVGIIADRPGGGITMGECTSINKEIGRVFEQRQILGEDYVVEVSSPGLDRALKTSRDFARAVGRKVRVHLSVPVDEKVEYCGKVTEAQAESVFIQTRNKIITIPLKHISKAVQVIE